MDQYHNGKLTLHKNDAYTLRRALENYRHTLESRRALAFTEAEREHIDAELGTTISLYGRVMAGDFKELFRDSYQRPEWAEGYVADTPEDQARRAQIRRGRDRYGVRGRPAELVTEDEYDDLPF